MDTQLAPWDSLSVDAYQKSDVINLMQEDLDFFASVLLPEVLTEPYPPLYHVVWEAIFREDTKYPKLALGLPRGFSKTTLMKLALAKAVLFTKKKYILIVAANKEKATQLLSDVILLLESANVTALFGNILAEATRETLQFVQFPCNGRSVAIQAIGASSDPRGASAGYSRPDFIVIDDAQSRDCAKSPVQAAAFREWLFATLLYARSERGCSTVYIGNMYPYPGCVLRELQANPDWFSIIIGAILHTGESLWEAIFPIKQLLEELQSSIRSHTLDIFFSEILNDTTSVAAARFDPSKMLVTESFESNQGTFVIIDPAGAGATSDDTALGVFALIDGVPYLIKSVQAKLTPLQTIKAAFDLCFEYGCTLIAVESYAYQASLLFWFSQEAQLLGLSGIEFKPVSKAAKSKNSFIMNSFTQVMAKEIGFLKPALGQYLSQVVIFDPTRKNNKDDLLDVVAYSPLVVLQYGHIISRVIDAAPAHTMRLISHTENCVI